MQQDQILITTTNHTIIVIIVIIILVFICMFYYGYVTLRMSTGRDRADSTSWGSLDVQQYVAYFLPVCCCKCNFLCTHLLGQQHQSQ